MAQKINNASKNYHKAFCEIHFIQVFSLSAICSIYIILLWILSDVKENKIKTALLCLVTCKLKCTGFMQTWTFFPHTVPRYCIFLWHFREHKATCERMLFLKRCIILKHTWAREEEREKGERRERINWSYSAFIPVSWILCIFYNLIVNQWVSSPHVTIKKSTNWKKKASLF